MIKMNKIKTMTDIVNLVTSENKERFMQDFNSWVEFIVGLPSHLKENIEHSMGWFDDGDVGVNEMSVGLKKKPEPLNKSGDFGYVSASTTGEDLPISNYGIYKNKRGKTLTLLEYAGDSVAIIVENSDPMLSKKQEIRLTYESLAAIVALGSQLVTNRVDIEDVLSNPEQLHTSLMLE